MCCVRVKEIQGSDMADHHHFQAIIVNDENMAHP